MIAPQRISVRNNPFVVSNEVRRKELKSAYKNVESLRIETVIKLNKHFDLMAKLRRDYFTLSKESEKLLSEMNT